MNLTTTGHFSTHLGQCLQKTKSVLVQPRCIQARKRLRIMHFTIEPPFLNLEQFIIEEFYKLKYCSTVVYMVPRA